MESPEVIAQKIRFDEEDRLPPGYWDRIRRPEQKPDDPKSKNGFKKIDPEEWVKAPAFVPKTHQALAESFGLADVMSFPNGGCSPDYSDNTASEYSTTSGQEAYWPSPFDPAPKMAPNVAIPLPSSTTHLPSPQAMLKIRSNLVSTTMPLAGQPPPLYSLPPQKMGPTAIPSFPVPPPPTHVPITQPPSFLPTVPDANPFNFVPRGYSANITAINPGNGPLIPAIVLKKKRKRRPRKYKDIEQKSFDSPASSTDRHPSDPNDQSSKMTADNNLKSPRAGSIDNARENSIRLSRTQLMNASSEPELNSKEFEGSVDESALLTSTSKTESNYIGGSCPDLSDDQLKIWDDILYRAVVADKEKNLRASKNTMEQMNGTRKSTEPEMDDPEQIMQTSIYELCPSAVFDAIDMAVHADGINSKDLRKLDKQLAGCSLEESFTEANMVDRLKRLTEKSFAANPALPKSLNAELEDLYFKPPISEYRYPQIGADYGHYHMTTYDPRTNRIRQELYSPDDDHMQKRVEEEDYFEGMNIRVNAFDECDDLALSESECPQPTRFQQIQWAFQRQKERYIQVQTPERVCCSIM